MPRFLYSNGISPSQATPGTTGLDHGTCMLSKYVGKDFGIVKRCSPVVINIPHGEDLYTWLDGLAQVINDVKARRIRKAVLSMSVYWLLEHIKKQGSAETDEGWIGGLWEKLKELARLNVVLVTASGNNGIGNAGTKKSMDGYPAIMGSSSAPPERRIPSLIVVGAMNAETGKLWHKSNFDKAKDLPHVFAPGENIKC